MKLNLTCLPRRSRLICAATVLLIGAPFGMLALAAVAVPAALSTDLDIAKFAFAPQEITVAPGTTVTWVNHDEAPHTVASNDKSFTSAGLDTDDRFAHTFASEGDFSYFCTVHPFMTGVVHVRKQ